MKKVVAAAILSLSALSQSAQALTLAEARAQGLVGETLSGYLAPVVQDPQALELVARINAARSASYQQLANSNSVSVADVANMAGQKLVARALPGEFVRGLNGKWLKK